MRRLLGAAAVVAASSALVLAGCTNLLEGKAVSIFADPFRVAGLPAVDGPSGLRPDAIGPTREIQNTDGGPDDELAAQAISDIEQFWDSAYGEPLKGRFKPARAIYSWESEGDGIRFCRSNTAGVVNALYCIVDDTIGYDRGVLIPGLRNDYGDMAVPVIFAHEYGHGIQRMASLIDEDTPVLVSEQQADCFAGVYIRWVVEGNSDRFTLNTADGLNNVLAAMISLRDPVLSLDDPEFGVDEHGSAFERVSAFQFGFTDGISACAAINEEEIKQRRGDLPVGLMDDQSGELDVTEQSVGAIIDALNSLFSPAEPPQLTFEEEESCPNARPSPPASYCPATNTISIDLAGLQNLGTQSSSRTTGLMFGDNTAYSVVASRYMLALQNERGGLVLDNAEAALRTACLTGVATTKLSEGVPGAGGDSIKLTAGDLDEAVSGILTNGLAASDVNGESVPAGFSRIDAFRTGVLGDEERCYKRYP